MTVICLGVVFGLLFSKPITSLPRSIKALGLYGAAVIILVTYQLHPFAWSDNAAAFNWYPFQAHYQWTTAVVLSNTIEYLWLYAAFASIHFYWNNGSTIAMRLGAFAAVMIAFALEWAQTWVAGRYPDMTGPILALIGYLLGWLLVSQVQQPQPKGAD